MADSLTTSKVHRLPYWLKMGLIVIGFMLFVPIASAETVKLLENTDICEYKPKLDMDYCHSKYEICDLSLSDVEKSTFKFQDEKSGYKDDLSSIYSKDVSIVDKGVCKELTISAYKSPFQNVDNVLCTTTKCYYEFAWWNSSFLFKFPINASTSSGQVTLPILLNDSNVTINNSVQYIWCNYTVNTTRRVVGYLYFTNESFYRCVDETETFSVMMDVDQGNESDFGEWEDNAIGIYHMNGTDGFDESIYHFDGVPNGDPVEKINGMVGKAVDFDGSGDFFDVGNAQGAFADLTIMTWVQIANDVNMCVVCKEFDASLDGEFMLLYQPASDEFQLHYNDGSGWGLGPETGTNTITLNTWFFLAITFDSAAAKIYLDGELKDTDNTASSALNANAVDMYLGARAADGLYDLAGLMDEVRIYNRTLSADEIKAIYNNTIGTHNFAPLGPVVERARNTSILGASFNISDFSFASSEFVTAFNTTFDVTETVGMILMSSMNIDKTSGGGTNLVSISIDVDGTTILSEDLRTTTGMADVGAVAIRPTSFIVTSGEHNISYSFKRTGVGIISISNVDAILLQNMSDDGSSIRFNITPAEYNHSAASFVEAFNWTIPKSALSRTFYTIKQVVTKETSGSSTLSYFFEDIGEGHTTPFWQRILSSATDVGSVAGTYVDFPESGILNYTIQSRQTDVGDTVTVNGSILDMDLIDSDENEIRAFQATNELTNLTNTITLGAGTHNLVNVSVRLDDGNAYFLSMMSSFGSSSGDQTPEYLINSSNSSVTCNSTKSRYLSSNSDIGNAVIYMLCENLTADSDYTFNLYVTVEAGETLIEIDESFNGFQVTTFDLIILQLPPISTVITNPINGTNVSGSDTITWVAFFDPNGDVVTYNITLENQDGTFNTTIGTTTSTSLGVTWNSFQIGTYFLQVEGCDPGGLCSDMNITITIEALPVPDLRPSITFCENEDILRTEVNLRIITDGNTSDEIEITRAACQYGCSNWTISTFGNPGCEEGDFWLALVFIIVLILVILIIRGAAR